MTAKDPALGLDGDAPPAPFGTASLIVVAMLLGALVGLSAPSGAEFFSEGIETTLLIMIVLLLFEVRLASIFKAYRNTRFLAIAWIANFCLIPLIAFSIASLFLPVEPLLFVGLMIYFLAPCTDWFLGFTRLARGDTDLGAALIPINIVTQLLLFPIWLWLIAEKTDLFTDTALTDVLIQWFFLPLLAAQALRFALEKCAPPHQMDIVLSWTGRCIPFVLAALVFQIFAAHIGELRGDLIVLALVAVAVCLFFAATSLVGAVISRFCRFDYPQRALLSMTMAARNAPLMLVLIAAAIPDNPLVFAVIVTGMLVEIPLLIVLKQYLLSRAPQER
ncbi:MAG: arsenic resistance protein [Pseudomonadota bacterium]